MNDDEHRKIIITKISGYKQEGSNSEHGHIPVTPVNRWVVFALLVPVVALMAVLGVFFFAAFLALFAIAAVGFAIRIWWLRRKFPDSMQQAQADHETDSDQTVIIEDAEIIEESEIKPKGRKKNRSDKTEG